MNRSILLAVSLLGASQTVGAIGLQRATAFGAGADTYLTNDILSGPEFIGGNSFRMFQRYTSVNSRVNLTYIRFDLSDIPLAERAGATLSLDFLASNRSRTWAILGLNDGPNDLWDEATTSYSNAPGVDNAAPLNSFAIDPIATTALGTFAVSGTGGGTPLSGVQTSSSSHLPLDSFLANDTNGLVTLMITSTDDISPFWQMATKETNTYRIHPHLNLPNVGTLVPLQNTVQNAKAQPIGSAVGLHNVVVTSVVDAVNAPAFATMHVQDSTGGFTIFGSTAEIDAILAGSDGTPGTIDDITEGDQLDIAGETLSFNGLTELVSGSTPLTIQQRSGRVGVPAPRPISLTDLLDGSTAAEPLESLLVGVGNVHFTETGIFAGATNYTIADESGILGTVRIPTTSNALVGMEIPTGLVNLSGLVTQFDTLGTIGDSGYQLMLRGAGDIALVPEPMSVCLLGWLALLSSRRRQV